MFSTVPRRVAWCIIGVTAAMLVVVSLGLLASGVALSNDNGRVLAIVEDCPTPGRDCYERGKKQGEDAVAIINRVSVLAAACADDPQRQSVSQIEVCVRDALKGQEYAP